MAYIHGTITGSDNLYDLLIDFLTTNPDLVAAGQNWDVVWDAASIPNAENASDVMLRGPGLADQDQVYVGMRKAARPAQDQYWFEFRGATGPLAGGLTFYDHIKVSPASTRIFTDSGIMEYWIVANGRRFAMVLKISTVFESMYAGLLLPYASPLNYPYPLVIAGSAGPADMGLSVGSWRTESAYHSAFVYPTGYMGGGNQVNANLWLLRPNATWESGISDPNNGIILHPYTPGGDFHAASHGTFDYNPAAIIALMTDAYGGGRLLTPITLCQQQGGDATYGIFDGIFACAGVANAAENIIQLDGVDHLVVQNIFRSSFYDYFAMALE